MVKREIYKCDIIIIGAGLAGLSAALELSKQRKLKTLVLTKVHPLRSASCLAQSGISSPLSQKDSQKTFFEDTFQAGYSLSNKEVLDYFCSESKNIIAELNNLGVLFTRENKKISQKQLAGHSFPRACYVNDKTGQSILKTLWGHAIKQKIMILEEFQALSLVLDDDSSCKGVVALEIKTGDICAFAAKAVILATGGLGQLYEKTTNPITSTGDGMAIAFRAGAPLKDMEFIQFHPTTLPYSNILIGEIVRGEGGILLNSKKVRFMHKYHPKLELAPRDILSRAIQTEIAQTKGKDACVYLDLRNIKTKLPRIHEVCKDFLGKDPLKELIPVQPAQHYSIGGISINNDCSTEIKGLFAAGECTCSGIHGANRLAGNSLMETIIMGKKTAKTALEYSKKLALEKSLLLLLLIEIRKQSEKIEIIKDRKEGISPDYIYKKLISLMTCKVGLFRKGSELKNALKEIKELKDIYEEKLSIGDKSKIYNQELIKSIELGFMLDLAEAIALSALERDESRGVHFREDHPKAKEEWLKHNLVYYVKDEKPTIKQIK